jgi:hypothetical protein
MAHAWHWTWATVAFAAELASLAALALGGSAVPAPAAVRLLAAIAAPVLAAVLWGLFAAPQAAVPVAALAVATKVLVQGAAVLALVATGHPRLAVALGAAAVLGAVLSGPPSALVTPTRSAAG